MRNFFQQTQPRVGAGLDLPSGRGFIALLEAFRASGGTAPGEVVGRLLEEHQLGEAVSLAKLIHSGQAFGFEWRKSLWIPMFQFYARDLVLKASAQSVRAELPSLWSGWRVATWFGTPNEGLHGTRPADQLHPDPDAVLRAAQSLAWRDGFSAAHARRSAEIVAHA